MSTTAFDRLGDVLDRHGLKISARATDGGYPKFSAQCPGHDDRHPSLSVTGIDGQALMHCHAGCDTRDVLDVLGLSMRDLYDQPQGAEYRYPDGRVVHRSPDKQFRQSGITSGHALYRGDQLAEVGTVYVVEGEKDVHALEAVGASAVCSAMGAGRAHKADWAALSGKHVVIVADHDEAGDKHAQQVAEQLDGLAADVAIVYAKTGKDAADHVAAGYGLDEFQPAEAPEEAARAVDHDGPALLDEIHQFAGQFLALPSPAALDAFVLWCAHAHAIDSFESTPRIAFLSPEPESGKTRTLEIADLLVPHPMHAVNCSPPALFRAINDLEHRPTILYDEVDTVFGPKAKENEEVRGLLNAGHRRGAVAYRCVGEGTNQKVAAFPAYAPVALAGIGDLPDTILGRSIVVPMRRRAPHERVEPFRHRIHAPAGHELRDRLEAWAEQHAQAMEQHYPTLPEGISDRPADVWEPLLSIAEVAGGSWPQRARAACTELVRAARSNDSGSLGLRLLADIQRVFAGTDQDDEKDPVDKIGTEQLLDRLHSITDAPWADLRGKPLDARGLARRLKPYGVASKKIDLSGDKRQGYAAEDLYDPWVRYLPAPSPTEAERPEPPERCSAQGADLVPDNNQVPATSGTSHQAGTRTTPSEQGRSSSSGSSGPLGEGAGSAHPCDTCGASPAYTTSTGARRCPTHHPRYRAHGREEPGNAGLDSSDVAGRSA